MKLRILHLAQFLGVGGLEKVLLLLINEQIRAGHEVELVVYDYEQTWVEYFRDQGIRVDTSFEKSTGYDFKLLSFISKKAKTFDVIHTHDLNPHMYAAPVKLLHTFFFSRFPALIHTAHGMDHLHKRPVTKIYEKLCSFSTNSTVGVSTAVCDYYRGLGITPAKLVNINNGTLVRETNPINRSSTRKNLRQVLGISSETLVWISVARIVPLKDQLLICELAKLNSDMVFLLVGPSGDDSYWEQVKAEAPPNVYLLGARSDISELLMASDFFISTSRHEGIPVSVLEAGALNLPCLLSDIDGHRVIQVGSIDEVAQFFLTADLRDLNLKATNLKNNKSLASALASALHLHVKENFSSTMMYQRYLAVYLGHQCSKN